VPFTSALHVRGSRILQLLRQVWLCVVAVQLRCWFVAPWVQQPFRRVVLVRSSISRGAPWVQLQCASWVQLIGACLVMRSPCSAETATCNCSS
jgi:hypothetical protein